MRRHPRARFIWPTAIESCKLSIYGRSEVTNGRGHLPYPLPGHFHLVPYPLKGLALAPESGNEISLFFADTYNLSSLCD